ncbi:MAG: lysophospholipid acyltransferase family protein [Candidatus Spyradocola sp.]|jgi:1-acyl-sn-glycerol-3-phosphate acyltransferase
MYHLLHVLAWILTTFWFRLRKYGRENIPAEGPAILICNHLRMMDTACIMALAPRKVCFMAKKELFENAFLRAVLTSIGTFPISRGEADISGIRTALKTLKDGNLLCIFPEGTRNKDRKEPLLPLQEGVAMISLRAKAPIVPLWVDGGYAPWRRCSIEAGAPMDLTAYQELRRPDSAAMRRLTAQMREDMLAVRADMQRRDAKK